MERANPAFWRYLTTPLGAPAAKDSVPPPPFSRRENAVLWIACAFNVLPAPLVALGPLYLFLPKALAYALGDLVGGWFLVWFASPFLALFMACYDQRPGRKRKLLNTIRGRLSVYGALISLAVFLYLSFCSC